MSEFFQRVGELYPLFLMTHQSVHPVFAFQNKLVWILAWLQSLLPCSQSLSYDQISAHANHFSVWILALICIEMGQCYATCMQIPWFINWQTAMERHYLLAAQLGVHFMRLEALRDVACLLLSHLCKQSNHLLNVPLSVHEHIKYLQTCSLESWKA